MPSRAAGVSPAATTSGVAILSSPSTRLWKTARWSSSKLGIGGRLPGAVKEPRGALGLIEQDLEFRQIGIPFDQARDRAEPRQRLGVERPDLGNDARAVVVDTQPQTPSDLWHAGPREMDLAERRAWQRCEIGARIPAVIAGADVDVVDVAQDAAAGAGGHRGEKFPFRDRRMPPAQIGGRVLDQDVTFEKGLHPIDMPADDVERLFGQRQRQKIGEIAPADNA